MVQSTLSNKYLAKLKQIYLHFVKISLLGIIILFNFIFIFLKKSNVAEKAIIHSDENFKSDIFK